MSETRGRKTGSIVVNGVVREMRNAYLHETTRNWRAGCCKSSKSWFGEGRTEKVWQQNLAGRLLYNILVKALLWLKEQEGCTVGQMETGTPRRVRKASGQKTTTASQQ